MGRPPNWPCRSAADEVAKAQMPEAAPADVRAEVAQGAMTSCMAKKGFYLR
jgi:hypothetical protein